MQQELGESLSIQPGSLSELMKKTEEKGYVRRQVDPKDKRRNYIYITPKGKKIADTAVIARREVSQEIFAPLTMDEKTQLLHILEKLLNNLVESEK